MEKNRKSIALERKVGGYLRPYLFPKFKKFINDRGMGESEAINEAVRLLITTIESNQYHLKKP